MTTSPNPLLAAGQAYLRRWNAWLKENPHHDKTAVALAMAKGDPPPDGVQESKEERYTGRKAEVAARFGSVITKLSPLQRRFVVELLSQNGRNSVTEAYRAAGGTSKHAPQAAHQVRWSDGVVEAIEWYFQQQGMTVNELVARMSQQARAEYARYIRPDYTVDLAAMIEDGMQHLIQGVRQTQYGPVVDFISASQSQRDIGRYLGIFTDNVKQTGDAERPIVIKHDLSGLPFEALVNIALGPPAPDGDEEETAVYDETDGE